MHFQSFRQNRAEGNLRTEQRNRHVETRPTGIVNFDFMRVLRGREGFEMITHLGFVGYLFVSSGSVFSVSKSFPAYNRCVFHLFMTLLLVELGLLMISYTLVNSVSCSKQNSLFFVQYYLIVVHDINYQYMYS